MPQLREYKEPGLFFLAYQILFDGLVNSSHNIRFPKGYFCFKLMTDLCKFSLIKKCLLFFAVFFYIAITNNCEAQRTNKGEIYSTLTGDTTLRKKKDSLTRL